MSEIGLSAILLDDAREAVVESRIGKNPPWVAREIRLSPADFRQVSKIKAREVARGVRPTLMGLFAVEDPRLVAGDFVIV